MRIPWPLGRPKPKEMVLEVEGRNSIVNPTEDQVVSAISELRSHGPSFASLTDERGNYVQVAGGRPWCMVEWRQVKPLVHSRATSEGVRRPYEDGAMLNFSAGPIPLRSDEWLLLKQASEIFVAFLRRETLPASVQWRSINSTLGIQDRP